MKEQKIERAVKEVAKEKYDLIIVGGGIYGVMLALDACRSSLRPLLLDKGDFIGETSHNHLRTVHGGIRYLQHLDITRFRDSVGERKWFLKYFPAFVRVMPCLMPLYNKKLHRKSILRLALLANDLFSFNRNFSVSEDRHLKAGKILSRKATKEFFELVDDQGLKGGALWYDASLSEFQRLFVSLLKLSAAHGAKALNYVRVTGLLRKNDRVLGVSATDEETGEPLEFQGRVVINAAGPWCRQVAKTFDRDYPKLFKEKLLLWNVLFDRPALSQYALGLNSVKGGGHTYFFHPWKHRLLVGTGEKPIKEGDSEITVPAEEMEHFIQDINRMVPGIDLSDRDIRRVYFGILPAEPNGKLTARPTFINHGKKGGPKGLYSISGVKFTTSRLVAHRTLKRILGRREKMPWEDFLANMEVDDGFFDFDWEPADNKDLDIIKKIIDTEAVVHLSDLILRRTSLGDNPARALRILPKIKGLFAWDEPKWQQEVKMLEQQLQRGLKDGKQ